MRQVTFRVEDHEKTILEAIAKQRGTSIAGVARTAVLKEINAVQVGVAFDLLMKGKVGKKRAWIISGLEYHEFMVEWTRRGAREMISDEAEARSYEIARNLDLSKFLK